MTKPEIRLSTLCYIRKGDQTLMMHRTKDGYWNVPGGKFEEGETPEGCVIREVKEETGLVIENPKLVGRITYPAYVNYPKEEHSYIFTVNKSEGNLVESSEGKLEWIKTDKILTLLTWEGDHKVIEWMKDGRFFSGKIEYNDDNSVKSSSVIYY